MNKAIFITGYRLFILYFLEIRIMLKNLFNKEIVQEYFTHEIKNINKKLLIGK